MKPRKMNFINVVRVLPEAPEQTAAIINRQYQDLGIDQPALSLSLHPEGVPARDKITKLTDAVRQVQKAVINPKIKIGILIQSTIGHGWSGRVSLCDEPWQKMIKFNGETGSRFCPLDSGFRNYINSAIREIMKTKPAFLLLDDDFTLRRQECLCPKHLAMLNAAMGKNLSVKEMGALLADTPADSPETEIYYDICRKTVLDYVREIRNTIDEADPYIPCTVCIPTAGYYAAADAARVLAGKHAKSSVRVNNSLYGGLRSPMDFFLRYRTTVFTRQSMKDIPEVLDESDTFPQNCCSESAAFFHAHISNAIPAGLNGCKLWLMKDSEYSASDKESASLTRYEKTFVKYRKYYETLLNTVAGVRQWKGVFAPLFSINAGASVNAFTGPLFRKDWNFLSVQFGFPVGFREPGESSDGIFTLTEDALPYLSDEQLKPLFKGALLIDSKAAKILTERGFAPLMGVEASAGTEKFFFSHERCIASGDTDWIMWDDSAAELRPNSPETRVITEFIAAEPGTIFKHAKRIAPGMTFFRNPQGGRIAVTGWSPDTRFFKAIRPMRREWLLQAMDFLAGGSFEMSVEAEHQALCLNGSLEDGGELLYIQSFGMDTLPEILLRTARKPVSVERLSANGVWTPVKFSFAGNLLRLDSPLRCCEPNAFRLVHP